MLRRSIRVSEDVKSFPMQVYDTLTKNVLKPSGASGEATLSHTQRIAAGCISGASACLVVFPLETLRTHAAMGKVNLKGAGAYFRIASAITRYKTGSFPVCMLHCVRSQWPWCLHTACDLHIASAIA